MWIPILVETFAMCPLMHYFQWQFQFLEAIEVLVQAEVQVDKINIYLLFERIYAIN